MRETCGSAVLHAQGPGEGKEPGALRAGFLEEEEHFRGADKGTPWWARAWGLGMGWAALQMGAELVSPGCQAHDAASLHSAQFKFRR